MRLGSPVYVDVKHRLNKICHCLHWTVVLPVTSLGKGGAMLIILWHSIVRPKLRLNWNSNKQPLLSLIKPFVTLCCYPLHT